MQHPIDIYTGDPIENSQLAKWCWEHIWFAKLLRAIGIHTVHCDCEDGPIYWFDL